MSTSKIEKNGITCLDNFLSKSEIIESEVSVNDRSLSWDGYLLVFETPKHNGKKNLLLGRVPVQVKASKRTAKGRETFDAEIADLKNYLNDGGALFIYVIFRTTVDFDIFLKLLLPSDIERVLRKAGRETGKIAVELTQILGVQTFETRCKHFLANRRLQFGGKVLQFDELPRETGKIRALALKGMNWIDTLLSGDTYFYYETAEGNSIPIVTDTISIGVHTVASIEINGEVFFREFMAHKGNNGEQWIEPNPCLRISILRKNMQMRYTEVRNASLAANDIALRFLAAAARGGTMTIGSERVSLSRKVIPEEQNEKLRTYENLRILLRIFNIDPNSISLAQIDEDFDQVRLLLRLFVSNQEMAMKANDEQFFRILNIGKRRLCILFRRAPSGKYRAFNLFERDPSIVDFSDVQISTKDPSNLIPCSRYLVLTAPVAVATVEGNFDHVTHDLISKFHPDLSIPYDGFLLNCISAYDVTRNPSFLDLAEKLIGLIEVSSPEPPMNCVINRKQILYRRRLLTADEKEELIKLKLENPGYLDLVLCCNILLGYFDEFDSIFRRLEEEKRKGFESWPIFNLTKDLNRKAVHGEK